eukprot:jgi/Antlo1/880/439
MVSAFKIRHGGRPIDANELFDAFREQVRKNKKLDSNTFQALVVFCKSKGIYGFLHRELTVKEATLLGRALMKARRLDVDSFISEIHENRNPRSAILLTCLLLKKSKIQKAGLVAEFLTNILKDDARLCYLNLMLVLYRNYREFFNKCLENFCRSNSHPICIEICEDIDAKSGVFGGASE